MATPEVTHAFGQVFHNRPNVVAASYHSGYGLKAFLGPPCQVDKGLVKPFEPEVILRAEHKVKVGEVSEQVGAQEDAGVQPGGLCESVQQTSDIGGGVEES